MSTYCEKLLRRIKQTGARFGLCVGLDPRLELITGSVRDFLIRVIDETLPFAAAYKPNCAYFEAMGWEGAKLLEEMRALIPREIPVVMDGKRSDIGETQRYYAQACYDVLGADAVTLNPMLGSDTIEPFLNKEGKGVYLLAVTSNPGAAEIEMRRVAEDGRHIFEHIQDMAEAAAGNATDVGLVVGLTNAAEEVMDRIADLPLLVPGLGAQGGEIALLKKQDRQAPILVNASRGILYANAEKSFADKARQFLEQLH